MKSLNIDLGHHSYPIHIGKGILSNAELIKPHIHGRQVFIISNEIVAPLYLDSLLETLGDGYDIATFILPDGEQTKSLAIAETVFTKMLEQPCNRGVTVVALGGGVVGDLSGFCAACYQRGVNFIQVPTTLLSQVDSSVGGKTGVNHPMGKNMIGAFHQPEVVIIDTDTLTSLDDRQFSAGLAEVIKYALLGDFEFLEWLEKNMPLIKARDDLAITRIIERSCQTKAEIVAQDEREQGVRALLNLGHTFAHAIENAKGYGVWLHGEAVGLGMLMAADLSCRMGMIVSADVERIKRILAAADLPVDGVEGVNAEQLRSLMSVDKKVIAGKLRLVLYNELGKAAIIETASEELIEQTLQKFIL
jgi:3-dehydroquinate synthase